jgi:hypothetical protein
MHPRWAHQESRRTSPPNEEQHSLSSFVCGNQELDADSRILGPFDMNGVIIFKHPNSLLPCAELVIVKGMPAKPTRSPACLSLFNCRGMAVTLLGYETC